MSSIIFEEPGTIYGSWKVISYDKVDKKHNAMFLCECTECGNIYSVRGFTLRNGHSKHCVRCNKKWR